MYFNKWLQFALSLLIVVTGAMAGFDWTIVFSQETSARIAGVIGILKLITNALAPAATQQVRPAGGLIVAQAPPGRLR